MARIAIIAHNIRSAHNIGSIIRTAEGLGIYKIFLTGYSPYPEFAVDKRLPHISRRVSAKINKTALGSDKTVRWEFSEDIEPVINRLKSQNFLVAALEQTESSIALSEFKNRRDIALVVGNEISGIDKKTLGMAEIHIQIPMFGVKESFNVAEAAAMALYHLKTS